MTVRSVEQVHGAWTLVDWRIEYDGERRATWPFGERPLGLIVYDRSGWMSATMSARQRTPFSAASAVLASVESKASALNEYLAYTGRWRLETSVLVHEIVTSLNPVLIGTVQRREASLIADRLELTAAETESGNGGSKQRRHTIVWQRAV
jgi:hypothetical protein